jgi:hypothetical protein
MRYYRTLRHVYKVSKIVVAKLRESKYKVLTVLVLHIFLEPDAHGKERIRFFSLELSLLV